MAPERINEIFQGVQELREWWKTTAQNKELSATECEKCGLPGFLGKELILHQGDTEERLVLCHKCHIKEHTKGG